MVNTLKIRAHHLLCIQGFQGYGYSHNFVANMTEVIKKVTDTNLEVEIIAECDVICSCCPYNRKGMCQTYDSAWKVKSMDVHVLEKLGLKEGTKGRIKDILYLVNTRLRNISDIQEICGDCDWKGKCLWFISRNKHKNLDVHLMQDRL